MEASAQRQKRRWVQQTLDGYFKKQKVAYSNEQTNSLLVSLPFDLLGEKLFGYLDVYELTNLASTCHCMASKINEYRGPLPYIVRQELCPKKIYYHRGSDGANVVTVGQTQTFRFLIKTKRHRVIQVNIRLDNEMWREGYNFHRHEGRLTFWYWLSPCDFPTTIQAKIFQQTKYKEGSFGRTEIFSVDHGAEALELKSLEESRRLLEIEDEDHPLLEELAYRTSAEVIRKLPSGMHIEDDLRDCVQYYWMSAMQAIAINPNICPSIHYFMSIDPIEYRLKEFYPKQYKYDFKKDTDRNQHAYRHHKPTSYQQWLSIVPSDHGRDIEYEIHEIPWFQKWYPKPSKPINKRNVLASLPISIFIDSLLPHLSFADLSSLSVACPALSARVLCSLKQK